jgi:hypothetical protein
MTTDTELHSSDEWSILLDVLVVNPDGWDRSNFAQDWARPITRPEFIRKVGMSTIDMRGRRGR